MSTKGRHRSIGIADGIKCCASRVSCSNVATTIGIAIHLVGMAIFVEARARKCRAFYSSGVESRLFIRVLIEPYFLTLFRLREAVLVRRAVAGG